MRHRKIIFHNRIEWRQDSVRGAYLHRTDGPAIEWFDGTVEWYLEDIELTFKQWLTILDVPREEKVLLKMQWG